MTDISSTFILEVLDRMDEKSIEALDERFKLVNRVRKGVVQRRKKVATKDGFTVRGGKITRMAPAERRARSLSQKKAARKRIGKANQANRKRKISTRRSNRLN